MTETSPVSTQTTTDDPLERRVSTVGRVHPHVEVKIVDAEGRIVPRGTPGEFCTRGYSVMLGYWDDAERTAQAIDAARWMHTGDLATMDADGYCNIVGRIKDMVIRGGENIYPREIEEFLYRHPKIQDVQVFGVPDARYGEELCAWIKLRAGETLTAEEVRDVLPRPDRALQGAAPHPLRRRVPDDGDRQDAEIHHARADDGGAGRAGSGDGVTIMSEGNDFDFIVTGAGSAGCVVAARLSESGRYRVLLLEAGGKDSNPWIHIPLGYAKTFCDPRVNWMFDTEPEPNLNNRMMYQPRGKVLGGTSSINGMVYMRGNHADYDEWRQRGCEGWDWDSVLPYFRKAEDNERGADEFHGVGGPLHVSNQPYDWELGKAAAARPASRPASRPIPTSTARSRKAAATTRPRPTTAAAGAPPPPICVRHASGRT